jgi:hypothetical protein
MEHYDVIVVGGGIAGLAAAVKAGRLGAKTALIEQYPFAGGMATAGMVSPFMKFEIAGDRLVKGIFLELEQRMTAQGGMVDNGFSGDAFRNVAWQLLTEAKVHPYFNAALISAEMREDHIKSVTFQKNGLSQSLSAKNFIDTSGDAQLLFLAGLPFQKGEKLQALTLFFRMGGLDLQTIVETVKRDPQNFLPWVELDFHEGRIYSVAGWLREIKAAQQAGRLHEALQYIFFTTLPGSGEGSFNTSNILALDGSSSVELTRAEWIGRQQVQQVVTLLQKEIPGFEKSYLIETAPQVGVRETRRAIGDYRVTGEDIMRARKFPDAVARGCYGVDIHGQADESSVMDEIPENDYYELPLRALLVKDASNLMVGGRCVSATREGHGALRIMPTSAAMGEAAGALSALASLENKSLRQVDYLTLKNEIKHNLKEDKTQ